MSRVLWVRAGGATPTSSSTVIAEAIVDRLTRERGLERIERDVIGDPIPHFAGDAIRAAFTPKDDRTAEMRNALVLSDALVDELLGANVIVISTPLWNFSIPSALKAWIDHIVRVDRTFRYDGTGPVGMLNEDTRLIIVESTGGDYRAASASAMNHAGPYLEKMFRFLGVSSISTFVVAGTAYRRAEAVREALEAVAGASL